MKFLRGCLAMFLLVGLSGTASGATPVAEVVATQVLATDSLRAHTFSLLVRMQGRAYDAYTGAGGMPWAEYLSRLGAHSAITEKVVETAARVP